MSEPEPPFEAPTPDAPDARSRLQPFDTPCARCGNFAPLSSKYGPALCATCIERSVDPVQKRAFDFAGLLSGTASLTRRIGPLGALLVVLAGAPITVLTHFVELPLAATNLYDVFVLMPVQMMIVYMAFQLVVLRAERPSLSEAARRVASRYGALLAAAFVSGIVIVLFLLLLVVPGIVKALSLALVMPIALLEGADASSAMSKSTARMRGHRLALLAGYLVALVPLLLAVVVVACVAGASVFLAMDAQGVVPQTTRAQDVVSVIFELATPALMLPITLMQAVAYVKTASPSDEGEPPT